jgi:hypothetical protein
MNRYAAPSTTTVVTILMIGLMTVPAPNIPVVAQA